MRTAVTLLFAALLLAACDRGGPDAGKEAATTQLSPEITADDIARHVQVLASDGFEGRAPASEGEKKTLAYLTAQFEAMGLAPGNGTSYLQEVPLVAITADPKTARARFAKGDDVRDLAYLDEMMIWTKRVRESVDVANSDVVFVGYGINAPEYGWNDYADVDVHGKTVLMFVNDPGFATGDPALFNGKAMTYYGRWTYKYEEAARQGAAAAIIIHETEPAAYPWDVVSGSWSGAQFDLERKDGNADRVAIEGWVQESIARELLAKAGLTLEEAHRAALERGFKAQPLGLTFAAHVDNAIAHSRSHNVAAILRGSERPDEAILYMAHWDHLGRGPADASGDDIYNGALDNATGVAGLLEIAQKFAAAPERPQRSVLFLAVTAEEQGLLGSAYYAAHPLIPPEKTVAAINMDGLNILGPMDDITVIGWGQNSLQDMLAEAAAAQGRTIAAEPTPEHGYFYRSDHFSLAKIGIPVLYTDSGVMSREHGRNWALEQREKYITEAYHKPADEYSPDWDLRGAVDDLELFYAVGARLANSDIWPEWAPDSEFRAARVASRGADGGN